MAPPLRFQWIGPDPAGRIAAVAGVPGDTTTYYMGAASGGIWKTTDAARTFAPIFDGQPVQAIGVARRRAIEPAHRLGGNRRGLGDPRQRRPGRRHLQIDRRGRHVAAHGPHGNGTHWPNHRAPDQPGHRVRLRARARHRTAGRARRLSHHGRRRNVEAGPVRRPEDRMLRPEHRPHEPEGALRRHVGSRDAHMGDVQRRPRQWRVRLEGQRLHVDAALQRPAELARREDRRCGRAVQLEARVCADPDREPGIALAFG